MSKYHTEITNSGQYNDLSVDKLWDSFTTELHQASQKHIPTKQANNRNKLPWVNQDLKRIARKRDRLYRKHRSSGLPNDRKQFLNTKTSLSAKIQTGISHVSRRCTEYSSIN